MRPTERVAMNRYVWIGFLTLALAFIGLNWLNAVPVTEPDAPLFNKEGELLPPSDYRDWVYLTSGLNMSYSDSGKRAGPAGETDEPLPFDNVFVRPSAYREFQRTGSWPDHTMFVIEIRASRTKVHPNQSGYVQGDVVGMPAAVKDVRRFGDKKWGYFSLMSDGKPIPSKPMSSDQCWNCHNKNGAVDNTFVQFYPTLKPIAAEKGTYREPGPGR